MMKVQSKLRLLTGLVLVLTLMTFSTGRLNAQSSMSIAPDNLILNAQGNFTNILCKYTAYLPSGNIHAVFVTMEMNGQFVAIAATVTYCPIDNMVFVEFDRTSLQGHPVVTSLANTGPVEVYIFGSFQVTDNQNNVTTIAVDRIGYMTIQAPGKSGAKP